MSINSNMKPYALQRYGIAGYDELGTPIYDYVSVALIPVSVNYTQMSNVENGIVYRISAPTGLTPFKNFELYDANDYIVNELDNTVDNTSLSVNANGNPYFRLTGNGHTFDIDSINQEGRFTQLILKEVFI